MRTRFAIATALALATALAVTATAGAAMVGIYRNGLESQPQRAEMVKLFGRVCKRGGGEDAIRVALGKKTDACSYRTPVIGRDLEIAATESVLSTTPKSLQKAAYVGLQLRAGGGEKYELRAFPMQKKAQLIRVTEGGTKYLAIEKNVKEIGGLDEPTVVRLRTETSGTSAVVSAYVGPTLVGEVTDEAASELEGEAAAVSIGATKIADGLIGSIDDLVVRVPRPF